MAAAGMPLALLKYDRAKEVKQFNDSRKQIATAGMPLALLKYDRAKEVKQFDDSKIGVKGLLDSGATVIPRFFVHPPQNLTGMNPAAPQSNAEIPIIDLSGVDSDRRPEIVEQIRRASSSWGFFQVINHGIPDAVLDDTIASVKSFNEQPADTKAEFYCRDGGSGFRFLTNFDLFNSKAASWRDTMEIRMGLNPADPSRIPAICRQEILAWDNFATGLAETLMELLSEGLGVGPGRLKEMTCLEARLLVGHYYPYCPQPELTLGIASHSDPGVLTLLQQNGVRGLQVKHGDEWVDVKPLPGALVINIGDLLQIISNGEFRSVDHRVLANSSQEPRISIGMFFNPSKRGETDYFGPFPELLSPEKPPLYRNFTIPEYMGGYFNKGLASKTLVETFKL